MPATLELDPQLVPGPRSPEWGGGGAGEEWRQNPAGGGPPGGDDFGGDDDDDDGDGGRGDWGRGDGGRWVTVATFWDPPAAHIARLKLDSEGIECFLADENIVATNWLTANAVGGVKLQVRVADARQAAGVLRRARVAAASAARDGEEPLFDGQVLCPRCGSGDLHRVRLDRRLSLLWVLLLGAPLPMFRKRTRCAGCGSEW